jgi:uncharacterized spore protein YtfJ
LKENIMAEKETIETDENLHAEALSSLQIVQTTLQEFLGSADVSKVYGEHIQNGDTIIIPASESAYAMGFGVGAGAGTDDNEAGGSGAGGGGGGWSMARPVAVVVAYPTGVRVEPVIDLTKIGLAALTAAGFMMATLMRMSRGR